MSRLKRKPANADEYRDRDDLIKAGYIVIEKSPWHWHVRKSTSSKMVNVWPTAMKFMEVGAHQTAIYVDVVEAMDSVFNDEEGMAQAEVQRARSQGLDYFRKKKK